MERHHSNHLLSYQWQHNLPELCRLFLCCTDLFSYITLFSTRPVRCVNIYARDDQTVGSFLSSLFFFIEHMINCKMQIFIMIDKISTNKATSAVDLLLSLFLV